MKMVNIGIAGCGGIGSNVASNLVRLGFKNLTLVDFDVVEESNLNRQFYFHKQIGLKKCYALKENLLKINSDLNIRVYNLRVEKHNIHEIFEDCEIIAEGFDTSEYKILLIEELTPKKNCFITSGLGDRWFVDDIKTKSINDHLTIIGDSINDSEFTSPLSPGVSIAAAKVAAAIFRLVQEGKKCIG